MLQLKYISYLFLIILILTSTSCVEQFKPEFSDYESLLVVEGMITNENTDYEIKVSRSMDFYSNEDNPEFGVKVEVIDDLNNTYSFHEVDPGVYSSELSGLLGEIGRKYKLLLTTKDGNNYESNFEELKQTPEIDSLYWRLIKSNNQDKYGNSGIYIYIDSHDPTNNTRYYRWEWNETWEVRSPFKKTGYPSNCYKSASSKTIQVGSSDHLATDVIQKFPLFFISNGSNKLFYKYSVLVKQFSLTKEAYVYWARMKETRENVGTLFDPVPSKVIGNIKNINNPAEPVLGYFHATSIKEKRIIVDRYDLPLNLEIEMGYDYCETEYTIDDTGVVYPSYKRLVNQGWIILEQSTGDKIESLLVSDITCVDCSIDADTIKPDYWEN